MRWTVHISELFFQADTLAWCALPSLPALCMQNAVSSREVSANANELLNIMFQLLLPIASQSCLALRKWPHFQELVV